MANFKNAVRVTVNPFDFVVSGVINSALAPIASKADELAGKVDVIDAEFSTVTNRIDDFEIGFRNDLNIAKQQGDEALELAIRNGDEIAEARIIADSAFDQSRKVDAALSAVENNLAKTAGSVLDLFDRVANIFNFLATLGTAARMEFIYNELKNQDEAFRQQIADILERLSNNESLDSQQQSAIDDLYRLLDMNTSQFDSLLNAIQALSQYLTPIYNNSFQSLYKLDDLLFSAGNIQSSIGSLTQLEIQTQTQISSGFNGLPPQLKTAVCEALGDCFEYPDFSGLDNKLDQILDNESDSGLGEVLRRIGMFPNNCLQQSISHALCGGGFGGGGIDFNEALEDYFSNNEAIDLQPVLDKIEEKGNEVITEIKNIPEPTLYVPDEWSIKLEGHRPQLIAGMQDSQKAGTGSASKWQIVIPRPKSSVQSMTWDELVEYFPKYNRGGWCAISKLKDGSVVRVRASSQNGAKIYLAKMMELVDGAYKTSDEPLLQFNPRFKSISVVCRGIAYYAQGRKDGVKPTKKWYFPIEDPPVQA